MYNNESAGSAFEEFLQLLGERVRLKGFEKYRAQLDTKSKKYVLPPTRFISSCCVDVHLLNCPQNNIATYCRKLLVMEERKPEKEVCGSRAVQTVIKAARVRRYQKCYQRGEWDGEVDADLLLGKCGMHFTIFS